MLRRSEGIWFFFFVYCFVGICHLLYTRNQEMKKAKTDIENIVQTVQPGYLKRGLRWRIPEDCCGWIELIKEYREGEKSGDVAVQVHPTESNQVKSQYEPPQDVEMVKTTTTTSYPPIQTIGLSSQ